MIIVLLSLISLINCEIAREFNCFIDDLQCENCKHIIYELEKDCEQFKNQEIKLQEHLYSFENNYDYIVGHLFNVKAMMPKIFYVLIKNNSIIKIIMTIQFDDYDFKGEYKVLSHNLTLIREIKDPNCTCIINYSNKFQRKTESIEKDICSLCTQHLRENLNKETFYSHLLFNDLILEYKSENYYENLPNIIIVNVTISDFYSSYILDKFVYSSINITFKDLPNHFPNIVYKKYKYNEQLSKYEHYKDN